MGYKMPIVCKEVYLPMNYAFIEHNDDGSFGDFAKKYKDEYGVDLHDFFELKKGGDNNYYIHQKNPSKIYAVGYQETIYRELDNTVTQGIQLKKATQEAGVDFLIIGVAIRDGEGAFLSAFGFVLRIAEDNLTPANIDDLDVGLWEI